VVRFVPYRWSDPSACSDDPSQAFRPCIDVETRVGSLAVDVAGNLPRVGVWLEPDGRCIRRYELPSGCGTSPNCAEETITLWLTRDAGTVAMPVRVPALLPPFRSLAEASAPLSGDESQAPKWSDAELDSGRAVQKALGQYLEFVNQLYDQARPSLRAWEAQLRDVAACSVARLAARWRRIAAVDAPPMALVVKFARRLQPVLEAVCRKPRRVLRRERVATPVGQIQEVDVACLRWISRQPGRTLVEKAGHKQQLQSVRRFEDADTLENRVVRDFLTRCVAAGRRYLSENQRYSGHERLLLVGRFVGLCQRLLRDSPIGSVRALTSVPQPNYVLQYEPAYHRVWTAYQLLLRRERQEEAIWRWRERTWSEMCYIAVTVALQQLCRRSPAGRSECFVHDEHVAGRFLDSRSLPGDWWFEGQHTKSAVRLVPDHTIAEYPNLDSGLHGLCPDFMIAVHSATAPGQGTQFIFFWTLGSVQGGNDQWARLASSLSDRLRTVRADSAVRGCLLVATDDETCQFSTATNAHDRGVTVAPMPRNLWTAQRSLKRFVHGLLDGDDID